MPCARLRLLSAPGCRRLVPRVAAATPFSRPRWLACSAVLPAGCRAIAGLAGRRMFAAARSVRRCIGRGHRAAVGIFYTRNLQESQTPDFVRKNGVAQALQRYLPAAKLRCEAR